MSEIDIGSVEWNKGYNIGYKDEELPSLDVSTNFAAGLLAGSNARILEEAKRRQYNPTKAETLTDEIILFRESDMNKDDYRMFIQKVAGSFRQGSGITWSELNCILDEIFDE